MSVDSRRINLRNAGATTEEWQASTQENLTRAGGAHFRAADNGFAGMATIRQTNAEHGRQRDNTFGQFQQKIHNTEELIKLLSLRIRINKDCFKHSEWSLDKLQKAYEALKGPTELCRNRILLREKRPKRERIFDGFQAALIKEEKDLQAAKKKMAEAITDTQQQMQILLRVRHSLSVDLQEKEHSLGIDNMCVHKKARDLITPRLDKCYSRQAVQPKAVLPEIQGTPREKAETDGHRQERLRQHDCLRDIEAAVQSEQAAKERWQKTAGLLDRCARALSETHRQTQMEMGAKIEHTELLKQELLKQNKNLDAKVAETHKKLKLVLEKLQMLEKPIAANMQRTGLRDQKSHREAITDEVTEALHDQLTALQGKKMQLQSQVAALQASMDELNSHRQHLLDDIADKDRALAIDRGCASGKKEAHGLHSFGFGKVGQGQSHNAETASSWNRQMPSSTLVRNGMAATN